MSRTPRSRHTLLHSKNMSRKITRSKHMSRKITRSKHMSRKMLKGGEAIASGSFGCVFRPALTCATGEQPAVGYVSKLMVTRNAVAEIENINQVRANVEQIPNYNKYFGIQNISICEPAPLSDIDTASFYQTCQMSLGKYKIEPTNLKNSMHNFSIINMPDLGMDLFDYLQNLDMAMFCKLNVALVDLLLHAIVPMNQNGRIHGDIKIENVAIDIRDGDINLHLIEWGASHHKDTIVREVSTPPCFTHNLPPGSVLVPTFHDIMFQWYHENTNHEQSDYHVFAEYLLTSIIQDSDSFREMLFLLINIITGNGDKEFLKTMSLQMDLFHLEAIVNKYCDPVTHAFDKQTYINEVYIHNADIFGFLTIYMNMFHMLEPVMSRELMEVWSTILNTFMYQETYAANPYDINKLVEMLLNLNTVAQCTVQASLIPLSQSARESESEERGEIGGRQLSDQLNSVDSNKRQKTLKMKRKQRGKLK